MENQKTTPALQLRKAGAGFLYNLVRFSRSLAKVKMANQTLQQLAQSRQAIAMRWAWVGLCIALSGVAVNIVAWLSGDQRIFLAVSFLPFAMSCSLVNGRFFTVPREEWPRWAKIYVKAAPLVSIVASLLALANLLGLIKLPHIFY